MYHKLALVLGSETSFYNFPEAIINSSIFDE